MTMNCADIDMRMSYQMQAANLLSSNPTLSSYFTLAAIDSKKHDGVSTSAAGDGISFQTLPKEGESMMNDPNVESSCFNEDLICKACGLHLSSAHFGTTVRLRSIRRGRTRRRRASRNKAKEAAHKENTAAFRHHRRKEWKSAGGDYTTKSLIPEDNSAEWKMFRVTDGEAVNCVVYTCGNCGQKQKLKGIPVTAKRKRKIADNGKLVEPKGFRVNSSSNSKEEKQKRFEQGSSYVSHNFVRNRETDFKGDIMSLAHNKKTENRAMFNRLDSRKKRKKNGGSHKKSDLMNFLSSLND